MLHVRTLTDKDVKAFGITARPVTIEAEEVDLGYDVVLLGAELDSLTSDSNNSLVEKLGIEPQRLVIVDFEGGLHCKPFEGPAASIVTVSAYGRPSRNHIRWCLAPSRDFKDCLEPATVGRRPHLAYIDFCRGALSASLYKGVSDGQYRRGMTVYAKYLEPHSINVVNTTLCRMPTGPSRISRIRPDDGPIADQKALAIIADVLKRSQVRACHGSDGILPRAAYEAASAGRAILCAIDNPDLPFQDLGADYRPWLIQAPVADVGQIWRHFERWYKENGNAMSAEIRSAARQTYERFFDPAKWPSLLARAIEHQIAKVTV